VRLVVTADLHFNHARGRAAAEAAADEIGRTPGDALLVVGDTAVADGDLLEAALARVRFDGPRLFVAGNHDLWTRRPDAHAVFTTELPRRVRAAGWHWLEGDPVQIDGVALVGSVGWYDYAFAPADLGVPERFYAGGVSPGAAERLDDFRHLLGDDVPAAARDIVVRWNDARHVRLGRSDAAFLAECVDGLCGSLARVTAGTVVAAVHHVPFAELLPPRRSPTLDFVRAYFGSPRLGEALAADPRVTHVVCGHTHAPADVRIGTLRAINVGSTYTHKRVLTLDVRPRA
jgi:hypothetical protein